MNNKNNVIEHTMDMLDTVAMTMNEALLSGDDCDIELQECVSVMMAQHKKLRLFLGQGVSVSSKEEATI